VVPPEFGLGAAGAGGVRGRWESGVVAGVVVVGVVAGSGAVTRGVVAV
jgi:hypothetical protein